MPQPRVLIVDDDPHLLEVLQLWLSSANLKVLQASQGDEAFRILRECGPLDLVLTDFMMPELNGIELLRLIKANAQLFATQVVVISNNADPEFRRRALEMGASAYLLKSEGAHAIADEVIQRVGRGEPRPAVRESPPALFSAHYRMLLESLLELLRLAAGTEGLPAQAQNILAAAQKLGENISRSLSGAVPPAAGAGCREP